MSSDRRKLRILVITMGQERQQHIRQMFSHPKLSRYFEEPIFSPGVSSRTLRSRFEFLRVANEAGILPEEEWNAIKNGQAAYSKKKITETFFDCLEGVPVTQNRRGSNADKELHYSVELWRKGKTINRGRAVLGCTFAHLIAIKTFVNEGFDILLEDNVRAPVETCAERVWETLAASEEWENDCHFRFFGWLGSIPNLEHIYETHISKRGFRRNNNHHASVFPFLLPRDIEEDLDELACQPENLEEGEEDSKTARKPGGNPIWGAYAYWISKEAYESVLNRLRHDVGAIFFRGRRARYYSTKPIDKILPRHISSTFGAASVHLSTKPCFFRAPMLTSKIHSRFDPEFCKSTEYQLEKTGLAWPELWLTPVEQAIIHHYENSREWLTIAELQMLNQQENKNDQQE